MVLTPQWNHPCATHKFIGKNKKNQWNFLTVILFYSYFYKLGSICGLELILSNCYDKIGLPCTFENQFTFMEWNYLHNNNENRAGPNHSPVLLTIICYFWILIRKYKRKKKKQKKESRVTWRDKEGKNSDSNKWKSFSSLTLFNECFYVFYQKKQKGKKEREKKSPRSLVTEATLTEL